MSTQEPADQFCGDLAVHVINPFGYRRTLIQRVQEKKPEEMEAVAPVWIASQGQ